MIRALALAFLCGVFVGFYICVFTLLLRAIRIAKDAVATSNRCIAVLKVIRKDVESIFGSDDERTSVKERIH